MVQYLLVEQYFLERFPQFPLFFNRIIDIYKDGHIVLRLEWEILHRMKQIWKK